MNDDSWNDSPAIPLPLGGPGQVPRCDQCKRQGTSEILKRCGGCSTMLYCSKECQKAAWPSHKSFCRLPPSRATELTVNPSPINVAKIVKEWILLHASTFKALLNTTVYLGGGVAHALSTPRGIVCRLVMRRDWDGNPAAPFHLVSLVLEHRDNAEVLGGQWDGLMASCKKAEEPFRATQSSTIAGVIPIVFWIKDNGGFLVNNYFPVSRTRLADDTALDERTRIALFGLNVHCKRCLDGGFVYNEIKELRGAGTGALDLGRYRKKGKKWKWERRALDDPELMEMWLQNSALTGGMTVPETWKVYDELRLS